MNEDISKLVGELTRLVKILGDKTGLEGVESTNIFKTAIDDGSSSPYDKKKQKVKSTRSMLTSEDKNRWGIISKIFAKSFFDLEKKENPNFGFKKEETGNVINVDVKQPEEKKSGFSLLEKIITGLVLTLAGLGLAIKAFFEGPGAAGKILQMLGTGLMKIGTTMLTGIVKIVTRFGSEVLKMLRGSPLAKNLSKIKGSGAFGKIFTKIASGMGKFLLIALRFLPGIGALVSFWFAYKNFKAGDWIGGIGEVASGILSILSILPGVGPIAGILGFALDIALLARYVTKTEEERVEQSGKLGDIFKMMGSWIADKFKKHIDKVPVIGTFIHMYRAYKQFKDGNVSEGMDSLIDSIFPFIPDLSGKIKSGWNFLKSLFNSTEDVATGESIGSGAKVNFNTVVKKWMQSNFKKLPWGLRKPLEWLGIISKTSDDPILAGLKQPAQEVGDNIKKAFSPLDGVGDEIKNAIPNLDTIGDSVASGFSAVDRVGDEIKNAIPNLDTIGDSVASGLEKSTQDIGSTVKKAFSPLDSVASDLEKSTQDIGSTVKHAFSPLDSVASDLEKSTQDIDNDMKRAFSSLDETFEGMKNVMPNLVTTSDSVSTSLSAVDKSFSKAFEDISSHDKKINDNLNKIGSKYEPVINETLLRLFNLGEKILNRISDAISNVKITSEINHNFPEKVGLSLENLDLNVSNNLAAMESLSERSIDILSKLLQVNIKHTEILQQIRQAIVSIPQGNSQPNMIPFGNSPGGGNSIIPNSEPLDSMFFADISNNDLTYSPSYV